MGSYIIQLCDCKIFGREFSPISEAQSKNINFFMSLHFSFIKNATIP